MNTPQHVENVAQTDEVMRKTIWEAGTRQRAFNHIS